MSKADVVRRIAPLLLDLCETGRDAAERVDGDTSRGSVVDPGDYSKDAA
jgi:hypothetical protein